VWRIDDKERRRMEAKVDGRRVKGDKKEGAVLLW